MISAEFNVILNNGGTPRKGASALHAEAVANTATAPKVHGINSGEKIGDCNLSRKRARETKIRYASFTLRVFMSGKDCSGWSGCRVELAPTKKCCLCMVHGTTVRSWD